ncbi:hypothetical protein J2X65_003152 [Ancylobacter sp. 3268]|uniref:hypothetical protein n=1 Tax=Ancylobacter sp. 3268 TaxID=2817752 RepID=UPI002856F38E|nr:hypothetical protein [Ancylobacter sp. 3268]MDR6953789.1 hypothetical protein [Ancylobacter sp. 3268]
MTPAQATASYRRQLRRHGEDVVLRRGGTVPVERTVKARVLGYAPADLVGQIQQGDQRLIVLAEDVPPFPVPFKERGADGIVVRGRYTTIQAIDDNTRRVAGVLIAYEIRVRG